MVRLLSFIFFAFIFSCTIIEDSDITSQEELDDLQYVSIEIKQETSSGTSTATAIVTSEAEVNIAVPAGTLTRQVWMDWPALSGKKLLLKSGFTTVFKSYTSFLESGKPWTFYLFSNTSSDTTILELYSFRYNSSGQLASVITRVPYVDGGPATSKDTLIYKTNGELLSITRKFPATGATTTFSNLLYQTSDNSYKLIQFNFQGLQYKGSCQGSGCGSYWGGNYDVVPTSNGFPAGVMNLTTFQREYLSMQDFNNIDQSFCGGSSCDAWIDTFYLHPLLVLKDHLNAGDDLLFIYMVDWWNLATTQPSRNNEKVTLSFNYDL